MVAPLAARIPAELYPFQGKRLDRDGLSMHYLDEGQGEPVVMLHGNPTWSIYFRSLVLALRPDYRTIVPDHIGMGLSDKPDDSRYAYRLESRVDDLELLLERLGLRAGLTLVVHDWGGMIGMAYASRHPERIARIVVLNSAAFHLPRELMPLALSLARSPGFGSVSVRGFNAFSRAAALVCCKRRPLTRQLRQAYCAPYDTWANRIATLRFVQDVPVDPGHPSYEVVTRTEEGLAHFRQTPVLICWGERDFVFRPEILEVWREKWPHAELHRFADCGHYVLEDAGEEICQRVRAFLGAHPVGASG